MYLQDISLESPDKAPSMRQLLIESKAETSDLRHQIELLTAENEALKGSNTLTNGHSSSMDSKPHTHSKLSEVSYNKCNDMLLSGLS